MDLKESLIRTIGYLTSEETAGRVSGSAGAKRAAQFLANELSKIGALPAGDEGYFSYLNIYAARLRGKVKITIGEKELKHRIDFGEIARFSNPNGVSLSGELMVVRDGDPTNPDELKDKVVLIPEKPKGFDLAPTVKAAMEIGIKALLIESGEPRWFSKGLQGARETFIPVFRVRKEVAKDLTHYEGKIVNIDLPLISEELECQNVLGMLHGADPSKTLVLSAHYDHLGDDPSGVRFPGAIDNATGVALILELAKKLSLDSTLPFNILLAFFTGEESGLLGAKHFVQNSKVPVSAVINVDSLGFEPKLIKMRNGHGSPGNWLADISAEIIQNHGVDMAWISGGEDSVAFQSEGITAIGLGQKPTDPSQRGIHTPDDTLANLYFEPLEKAYGIIDELIRYLVENSVQLRKNKTSTFFD